MRPARPYGQPSRVASGALFDLYCYSDDAIYVGYGAHTQNPNAMYDKGKFRLPLWYDSPANLMSDIVKCCMC